MYVDMNTFEQFAFQEDFVNNRLSLCKLPVTVIVIL